MDGKKIDTALFCLDTLSLCCRLAFIDINGLEYLQHSVACILCGQVTVILRDDDSYTKLACICVCLCVCVHICVCGGWGRVFMGKQGRWS